MDPWAIQLGVRQLMHPAVAGANYYQFAPGETITSSAVESRALVWGVSGTGSIRMGEPSIDITPGSFVFLPWRHSIEYHADPHDPFMVGAVHLIPWHDPAVPIELYVAHGRTDHLAGVHYRRDADWPDLRGLRRGGTRLGDRLLVVASLAVTHVQDGEPDGQSLRALAVLLLNELRMALARPSARGEDGPPRLMRMQEYVVSHLHAPLAVAQVAAAGGVSASTAERLFRQYEGQSVGRWLIAKRMSVARDLLRTTNRSVAEVARAVGMEDPAYFSRVFRRTYDVPPSSYAARSRPF